MTLFAGRAVYVCGPLQVVLGSLLEFRQEHKDRVPLGDLVLPFTCGLILVGIGGAQGEVNEGVPGAVGLHLGVVPEVAGEGEGAILCHGCNPFCRG